MLIPSASDSKSGGRGKAANHGSLKTATDNGNRSKAPLNTAEDRERDQSYHDESRNARRALVMIR